MHIPDGYIGPQTYITSYLIMAPIWAYASKMLRKSMNRKQIPLLALGAAFSFIVMFLNVPVLGRLSAHPVGAGLLTIICGPWAACIGISAALAIQACPFQDGGLTAFATNCLNMAVIMPFISWWVYRLIIGNKQKKSRIWFASAAAGYLGVVAASAAVGIEIGLQSSIAKPGQYLPYGINIALPAMLLSHLLIVGPIEAVITAASVGYLFRHEPWTLSETQPMTLTKKLLSISVVGFLLAPLGILLPQWFGSGPAWGEWGNEELKAMFGYVPKAIERGSNLWHAPMADYALPGHKPSPVSIVIVAIFGAVLTIAVGLGIGKLITRRRKNESSKLAE